MRVLFRDGNRLEVSTSIIRRPYRFDNRLIIEMRNFGDCALLNQFWNKILSYFIIRTSLSIVTHNLVDIYRLFSILIRIVLPCDAGGTVFRFEPFINVLKKVYNSTIRA